MYRQIYEKILHVSNLYFFEKLIDVGQCWLNVVEIVDEFVKALDLERFRSAQIIADPKKW